MRPRTHSTDGRRDSGLTLRVTDVDQHVGQVGWERPADASPERAADDLAATSRKRLGGLATAVSAIYEGGGERRSAVEIGSIHIPTVDRPSPDRRRLIRLAFTAAAAFDPGPLLNVVYTVRLVQPRLSVWLRSPHTLYITGVEPVQRSCHAGRMQVASGRKRARTANRRRCGDSGSVGSPRLIVRRGGRAPATEYQGRVVGDLLARAIERWYCDVATRRLEEFLAAMDRPAISRDAFLEELRRR